MYFSPFFVGKYIRSFKNRKNNVKCAGQHRSTNSMVVGTVTPAFLRGRGIIAHICGEGGEVSQNSQRSVPPPPSLGHTTHTYIRHNCTHFYASDEQRIGVETGLSCMFKGTDKGFFEQQGSSDCGPLLQQFISHTHLSPPRSANFRDSPFLCLLKGIKLRLPRRCRNEKNKRNIKKGRFYNGQVQSLGIRYVCEREVVKIGNGRYLLLGEIDLQSGRFPSLLTPSPRPRNSRYKSPRLALPTDASPQTVFPELEKEKSLN